MSGEARLVLASACEQVGFDVTDAQLIRAAENTLFRLPGGVVARVTRSGQLAVATKEVRVSRWLQSLDMPVVEALADVEQPVSVEDRAITFWRELPEHRYSTTDELATMLRRLHDLPAPDFELPLLDPFVRLRERLAGAGALNAEQRSWLLDRLSGLEAAYAALPSGRPWCAVHGDAWAGNLVVTDQGPVILDLERFAFGPPEWDLTSPGVDYTTIGSISAEEWADFCAQYGYDVTTWAGFETLRDARELRKVTFALQLADQRSDIAEQARYRLACLRGENGPRPWGWSGVP